MTVPTLVLSSSSHANALGRAIAMALVAREVGPAVVLAPNTGRLWPPAEKFGVEIEVVSRRDLAKKVAQWVHENPTGVLWVSKGLSPWGSVLSKIRAMHRSVVIIFDQDDDDEGLADDFKRRSVANRLRLTPLHQAHPRRIRRSQRAVRAAADALTYSSHALRRSLAASELPFAVIAHGRRRPDGVTPHTAATREQVRVGFLGTMRAHKGASLVEALTEIADFQVVAFEGAGVRNPAAEADGRLRLIPADTPISDAYAQVDVALVLLDAASRGAAVQLPAKLADALAHGVPVVASRTEAIQEVLGTEARYVAADDSTQVLEAAIRSVVSEADPARLWAIFDRTFSVEVLGQRYWTLVDLVRSRRDAGH